MSSQNIVSVYNLARVSDVETGKDWYPKALRFASNLASVYNIEVRTIVAVIASLSPRNRWERNMQDAESMVKCYAAGGDSNDLANIKVCTFGSGKKKAIEILTKNISSDTALLNILKGPKLCEFYNCILGQYNDVCIDGHAYSIWLGDRVTLANVPSIGVKLRRNIKADYQAAAKELGISTAECQAVTWIVWRRIFGVTK
jgi:hypothetical protein